MLTWCSTGVPPVFYLVLLMFYQGSIRVLLGFYRCSTGLSLRNPPGHTKLLSLFLTVPSSVQRSKKPPATSKRTTAKRAVPEREEEEESGGVAKEEEEEEKEVQMPKKRRKRTQDEDEEEAARPKRVECNQDALF